MGAAQPIAVDDPIEPALTPREFCALLQIQMGTFYNLQRLGRFARFELVPRIGPHRYSRRLVREYLDRTPPAARLSTLREVRR